VAAAAAARPYQGERRRRAVVVSLASSGTAYTQWWVREKGEISRPVMAQQVTPAYLLVRRSPPQIRQLTESAYPKRYVIGFTSRWRWPTRN
jgi:hypothetical protein